MNKEKSGLSEAAKELAIQQDMERDERARVRRMRLRRRQAQAAEFIRKEKNSFYCYQGILLASYYRRRRYWTWLVDSIYLVAVDWAEVTRETFDSFRTRANKN